EELATKMNLDARARHRLRRMIEELLEAGTIEKADGGRYRLPPERDDGAADGEDAEDVPTAGVKPGVTGHIRVHPAGYGFVERDDGEDDVFVAARHRGAAMDGDHVEIMVWLGYKGPEGRVGRILDRGRAKLTGIVRVSGSQVMLEPDDPR